jgi:uncharacterized protein (TIGR04141 family)
MLFAMPSGGIKTQHLTVFLLREDVATFDAALEKPDEVDALDLVDGLPFVGRLYVKRPSVHPPGWLDFVGSGVAGELDGLVNAGTAALLLVQTAGRLFAFTFGHGRFLLRTDCWVRDFGLKVVLNTVDPDRLRSIELRVVEEMVISRRTDASRASSPGSFGLDPGRDIMRGVAGQPAETGIYGKQIFGSDAVAANLRVEFRDLSDTAARFLAAYNDTLYRARFGWVDQVKIVKRLDLVEALEARLLAALTNDAEPRPYLAPPEMLAWSNIEFTYTGDRGARHADLDLDDYLANVDTDELDIDRLRQHQVRALMIDSDIEQGRWTVYACIVFETRHDDKAYVLSEGQWFEIASSLVDEVRDGLASIPAAAITLPSARDGEWEGEYNERAVHGEPSRALLDKQLSRVAAEHGPIEICDILTEDGQFVHVKRKTQSATLSHLFSQGRISADVFRRDPDVRDRLRAKLAPTHPAIAARIPDGGARVNAQDFEVVYAVITAHPAGFPQNLPFFSRLNLWRTYQFLTATLDYRASVLAIEIEP